MKKRRKKTKEKKGKERKRKEKKRKEKKRKEKKRKEKKRKRIPQQWQLKFSMRPLVHRILPSTPSNMTCVQ